MRKVCPLDACCPFSLFWKKSWFKCKKTEALLIVFRWWALYWIALVLDSIIFFSRNICNLPLFLIPTLICGCKIRKVKKVTQISLRTTTHCCRNGVSVSLISLLIHSVISLKCYFVNRIDSGADSSPTRKRSSKSFLSALKRRAPTEVNEADRFLNEGCLKASLKDLDRFPIIKKIFV
jgi:hypothetical protein